MLCIFMQYTIITQTRVDIADIFDCTSIVLPEMVTTVSRIVTIISRSLYNDTEFSLSK